MILRSLVIILGLLSAINPAFAQVPGSPPPRGVGVQAGQSPTAVGDTSVTLTAGNFLYYTNTTFTAPRTWTLPTSTTQNIGDFEIVDVNQTITSTNTLTITTGGTDKLNGVINGTVVLYAPGSAIRVSNDGAGNYTVAGLLGLPNLASGQIYVGNASGLPTAVAPGTGLTSSGGTVISQAVEHISYQPGLITTIVNTKSVFSKFSKASTVDNLTGSASVFNTCTPNPTITIFECGTDASCGTPTTIGSVTVTAAGQAFTGTISSAAITAGDYVGWAITAGSCASLDIGAVAQVHSN